MRVMERTLRWTVPALLALLVVGCGKDDQTEATLRLDAGTEIRVSPLTALSPVTDKAGSQFTATLAEPLKNGEQVIVPKGNTVVGEVVDAQGEPGETGSFLSLQLKEVMVNGGRSVAVKTDPVRYTPEEHAMSVPGDQGMASGNPANKENPPAGKENEPANPEAQAPMAAPENTVVTFRLAEPVEIPMALEEGVPAKPLS